MTAPDETQGGGNPYFPSTNWSDLNAIREASSDEQRELLNTLIRRYWKPVYVYLRRKGHQDNDAKDLVQEFFMQGLSRQLFTKADCKRGRFRSFLLSCLDNFLIDVKRAAFARCRHPEGGFVSIDQLDSEDHAPMDLAEPETAETLFHRTWARELLLRVLRALEASFRTNGKEIAVQLLRERIIAPALDGAEAPALRELATRCGITEKQASNTLVTARRFFQRLLRQEIAVYATSEAEITSEVSELFELLSRR